jgi:hypothetical protein
MTEDRYCGLRARTWCYWIMFVFLLGMIWGKL